MRIPNIIVRRPFIALTIIYIITLIVLDYTGFFSVPPKNNVSHLISEQYVNVKGKVINVPEQKNNKIQLVIKVFSVNKQETSGKILVTLFSLDRDVKQGDIITFYAKLLSPPPARNPGAFDYAAYLHRNNIYTMAYISSFVKIGHSPLPFYQSIANTIRANMIDTIHRSLPQEEASVLIPMLIGEKSELSDEEKKAFQNSGLTHILVVSGLNIAYVVIVFLGFFRITGFKRRYAALLTIPFILLFMLMVGDNPPAVRATVMALFLIVSLSLAREPLIYQSLAMAAMTILVFDPQALFNASFQLSFAATIGIVYLYPLLIKPFQNFPRWIQNSIGATIAVSLAAQLAVLPIIAYYFNKVSLIGLVSNIPVVPLSGVITALGIVLYLIHFVSHVITVPVVFIISLLLRFMLGCVHLFAAAPFAIVHVAAPSIVSICCYYVFLFGIFHIRRIPKMPLVMGVGATTILLLMFFWLVPPKKHVMITSLYAGDGTAVHIAFPGNKHWLIDTGRNRDGERVILPYLRSKGIRRIEKIIITSDDKRHCGGLKTVSDNFPVSEIIYPKGTNHIERYIINKSTVTLVPITSIKNGFLVVCLDYAWKRIVFTHQEDIRENGEIRKFVQEKSADVLHVSCHRKQADLNQSIKLFQTDTIILSGTVPEELPKTGKIYPLKQAGSVSATITSDGIIHISPNAV
jgi:competence protein ComEC